jgi:hypothetical protein
MPKPTFSVHEHTCRTITLGDVINIQFMGWRVDWLGSIAPEYTDTGWQAAIATLPSTVDILVIF